MSITPPPTPPTRSDPDNFDARADGFFGWFQTMAEEHNADMDSINGSVDAAQAAAAAASASVGTTATSTTSLTIGLGAKTLTIQTGKVFVAGQWVVISHSANTANQMIARIDGYNSGSGQLDVTVMKVTGSGTATSWVIGLTPAFDTTALQTTGGTMSGPISEMGNSSTIKDPAGVAQLVGYRGVPVRDAASQQTLALADVGTMICITTGGIIIPANASVAFARGDAVQIYNDSGSSQTITAAGGVTLRLSGTTTTGARTLKARGSAFIQNVKTNEWRVSGDVS